MGTFGAQIQKISCIAYSYWGRLYLGTSSNERGHYEGLVIALEYANPNNVLNSYLLNYGDSSSDGIDSLAVAKRPDRRLVYGIMSYKKFESNNFFTE